MLLKKLSCISALLLTFILISCSNSTSVVNNNHSWYNLDTVRAQRFDTGRMWTFEDAPLDYFEAAYNFRPTEDWLDHTRLSTLKLANWCTASFVSEDGLIMTNHHCVDFITQRFEEEGEDINTNGFYAQTLDDERKIPNLYVDQLVLIQDVTDDINMAIDKAPPSVSKIEIKENKINELQKYYTEETGLICKITELYNGGKYSLYGYKRYNDIRAVLVLEADMGLYGGDPDNFTYPRYNPDFAFLRAYDEDGKPLKVENYFTWSNDGPQPGQPIFVVGNPGSTQRLKTVAQLIYERDVAYRYRSYFANGYVDILLDLMDQNPENIEKYKSVINYIANSAKVYRGVLAGLRDPVFMARKKDFEKTFKSKVQSDPKLNEQYGFLWDAISNLQNEKTKIALELNAYKISKNYYSKYFLIAQELLDIADQLRLPEESRNPKYKDENLTEMISEYYDDMNDQIDFSKLILNANFIISSLQNSELVNELFSDYEGKDAAEYAVSETILNNQKKVLDLINNGAEAIYNSDDPFIKFAKASNAKVPELQNRIREIEETEEDLEYELGRALFEVYGTSIPPDATFTLRINDGIMKSYEYNGTIAPLFTTFYGLYNRYYSHQKKYPWDLPERWLKPGPEFDMETPYNFISTNDIVGGSSGSPVINKNGEIIGIAFDGNMESLPGNFIYSTEANRMVSVASQGILEIVDDLLNADRVAEELKNGKIITE